MSWAVECDADFVLIHKGLRVPRKEIYHAGDKGRVVRRLEKKRQSKGLIDEDPGSAQPSYLKKMQIREAFEEEGLKVLEEASKKNRVIVICPRLEEWILKAAEKAGMNVEEFNLPRKESEFRRAIKGGRRELEKLGRLVELLSNRSRRFEILRSFSSWKSFEC